MKKMSGLAKVSSLGTVMQLAYVPVDFDEALKFWTRTMGVGPFFHLRHIKIPAATYRGQATQIDFSMGLAYWNDMQIELIQPHDGTPSVYSEWLRSGQQGVHHMCLSVSDMNHARRVCIDAGAEIVQEFMLDGGEAIYVDTGGGPGTMIEILQPPPAITELFAMIRVASKDWDGRDPLRVVG